METTEYRLKAVQEFLTDIKPGLIHKVVPIIDIYGPAATDPSLDCIVVSCETIKGGDAVNELRASKVDTVVANYRLIM